MILDSLKKRTLEYSLIVLLFVPLMISGTRNYFWGLVSKREFTLETRILSVQQGYNVLASQDIEGKMKLFGWLPIPFVRNKLGDQDQIVFIVGQSEEGKSLKLSVYIDAESLNSEIPVPRDCDMEFGFDYLACYRLQDGRLVVEISPVWYMISNGIKIQEAITISEM